VYVPDEQDNQVKEYIRMRDDQKLALKKIKQQILAFVLRQGKRFEGGKTYWTIAHRKWLYSLELKPLAKETLSEYLITYEYLVEKIERLDKRIEELASEDRYCEKVKKLGCFMGIRTHTALSMIVEVGDFERFAKARQFSGFLGIVPSEDSSADDINRYGITKAGNRHLRYLMVEAAQSYTRGSIGHKSIALKKRQEGCSPEVIAYADKANERLRRRFYTLTLRNGVNRNKAVTAIARELSCFIWGMMTENVA
jgi:transposase